MTTDDPLATAAVQPVTTGMIVGLGTGRAASRAIEALARRALEITCVATSRASEALATKLGLRVLAMESVERVDYLFDGADEVDASLRMIKGRGGAMTREKVVAQAATRRVYLVHATKLVERLGETAPLPIEVLRFALATTLRAVHERGLTAAVRADQTTDDGNPIIDATLPPHTDLASLAVTLDAMAGVVGHGLFLTEADCVLVEDASGHVRTLRRTASS